MESRRQKKVAKLIKEVFSEMLLREGSNYYGAAFVTVVEVAITPDLGTARIYLSVYNVEDKQSIIDIMNANSTEIRGNLGRKMRHDLRIIPHLRFYLDDTLDNVFRIEEILKNG